MDKRPIRNWSLKITVTVLFLLALLIGIALDPILLYGNSTVDGNYTIHHQQKIDDRFSARLHDVNKLLASSELYDGSLKLSVCLNDGSYYPGLMQKIMGKAFGFGFDKTVVLLGNMNAAENYVEINDYKWNLTELLAHEATHCLEFHRYGFWHSNPIAHIPEWKWEWYPEYIARKNKADLVNNIRHLLETEKQDNNNWIDFEDGTGTVIPYYKDWLLVQYCLDVRKLTFDQLLKDTTGEDHTMQAMMAWYKENSKPLY
jgi:hypothetical protein